MQSAGSPILTRGIVEVIRRANDPRQMSPEMINWLVYRHHDLIEDTIKRLLDGEDLGGASEPWRSIRTNVPKITNEDEAVEYFINKYGEEFFEELSNFSGCWKRAALIIGYMLTKPLKLPDKEEYSNSEFVDVLNPCGINDDYIDDYLLVGNEIPDFVELITTRAHCFMILSKYLNPPLLLAVPYKFVSIFTNEYENVIKEAKKLLEIWRKRGRYYDFEARYALGLVSIIVETRELGKVKDDDDVPIIVETRELGKVKDDVDAILKAILSTVKYLFYIAYINTTCIKRFLKALESPSDKAPQYLEIQILDASSQLLMTIPLTLSTSAPKNLEAILLRMLYGNSILYCDSMLYG
jgi:hypothetical protein